MKDYARKGISVCARRVGDLQRQPVHGTIANGRSSITFCLEYRDSRTWHVLHIFLRPVSYYLRVVFLFICVWKFYFSSFSFFLIRNNSRVMIYIFFLNVTIFKFMHVCSIFVYKLSFESKKFFNGERKIWSSLKYYVLYNCFVIFSDM